MRRQYNPSHLAVRQDGVAAWNVWRAQRADVKPDLRAADLKKIDLHGANLRSADLYRANLWKANLSGTDLSDADLSSVTMNGADLRDANLSRANLRFARLVGANVANATFSGAHVYGCSVWNLIGAPKDQTDLVITPPSEAPIAVDNIEVAQFVYLLLTAPKIRNVVDTVGKKAVLILGRFTPERKVILNAIRDHLRARQYIPILFDFEVPATKDVHETVLTLAGLSRFIVADISDPKSIPQELTAVVPHRPSLVVVPLLQSGLEPWSMFSYIQRFPWVLPIREYTDLAALLRLFDEKVIEQA